MQRERWTNRYYFLFAAIGSAIGLGNLWRFPYITYKYGGGAFLIPWIVGLIVMGIPWMMLEFGMGRHFQRGAPGVFEGIGKKWEWLGWWAVIFVMFGIELYYTVIIAWCLDFFVLSFNLGWGPDPNAFFFKKFLATSGSPGHIGGIQTAIFAALIAIWFANWYIVYRGVSKGIEKANKIFMPLLFILTAVLVFWAITLKGAGVGIKAYLTPDFTKLTHPKVWIDAYSQIFFTLSLGFGIMIAYASYLPKKAELTKNTYLTAFINCGYSIFAGFAVFSVLGFMATNQGKPLSKVVSQSIGLAFVAYPKAVSLIPGGNLFGAIFFLCLFMAGLSSSVSIMEAFVSAMVDKFEYPRKKVVIVCGLLGFLGSIIFTTQGGLYWLDIVDHFITHYGLVTVGILEAILVGWFLGTHVLRDHINRVSSTTVGLWWDILIKYFVPLVLGIILVGDIYHEVTKPYGGYSWAAVLSIGMDWIILTILVAITFASRPWRVDYNEVRVAEQFGDVEAWEKDEIT